MIAFLRRLWPYVQPYRGRLMLGVICGVIYGLSNGAVIVAIKLVVNLVFGGGVSVAEELSHVPQWLHPLAEAITKRIPQLSSPSSMVGLVLAISTVPAVMLVRCLFGYLNVYLMTWSAARAIADLRTRLFAHLQNLSLSFFSKARTGDLISRITNDTHLLYGIVGNSMAALIKDPITILVLLVILLTQ